MGLLKEEPLHGYEVKNRFEAMLGGTWEVNIGRSTRRSSGSSATASSGRSARGAIAASSYELLPEGQKALDLWLAQPTPGPAAPRRDLREAPARDPHRERRPAADARSPEARSFSACGTSTGWKNGRRRDGRIDLARLSAAHYFTRRQT
jgi:Predicted transcriptional regulators